MMMIGLIIMTMMPQLLKSRLFTLEVEIQWQDNPCGIYLGRVIGASSIFGGGGGNQRCYPEALYNLRLILKTML